MDVALLSANVNQLRYVFESPDRHPYYYFSLGLIIVSVGIHLALGLNLIWSLNYDANDERDKVRLKRNNNRTMILIFLSTFVNVFIAAFGVANNKEM